MSFIGAASAAVAIAIFEAYLGVIQLVGDGTRLEGSVRNGFIHSDDVLGYAPDKDSRVSARKYHGNELLYDVTYTIDMNGLRIAPDHKRSVDGCVVFFGDSHTFGEGVNDNETLPYQVGVKTGGRHAIYNFGFSGYGPHQMLASLQSGLTDRILKCTPTSFVYVALLEHAARVAGLTTWDKHGPRFELDANGVPVRKGNFDDPRKVFGDVTSPRWLHTALDHSFIWQRLFGRSRLPDDADLGLFMAVIEEAARLTRKRYPESTFSTILWDGQPDPRLEQIAAKLTADGLAVYKLTSAIPDIRTNLTRYILSIHDRHPDALQDERLAEYVVHCILGE